MYKVSSRNNVPDITKNWVAILLITATWLAMVALVNPVGNFPLNDDWAYAASVKELLNGRVVIPDWSAANIFAQIVWGTIFSELFGFSYTVLRASTLVLGLIGIIASYKLLRELKLSRTISTIVAMTIAVNPIYFASSNTFMTDIPFFAFSTLSLFYLVRAIHNDTWRDISLGTITAGVALLVRQIEFAIPLAFAFSYFLGKKLSPNALLKASIPLITCLTIQVSFKAWLHWAEQTPTMYGHQISLILDVFSLSARSIIAIYGKNIIFVALYLGLFISPVLLYVVICRKPRITLRQTLIVAASSTLVLLSLRYAQVQWPPLGNILNNYGIGPILQHGSVGYYVFSDVLIIWKAVGVLSIVFGCVLFYLVCQTFKHVWISVSANNLIETRLPVFFGTATFIYLLPVVGVPGLFDRYLLLPFLTMALFLLSCAECRPANHSQSKLGTILAFSLISIIGILSTLMVHDYLSWNRVRWQALVDLVEKEGIAPNRIDGGFEFNGTYLYSKNKTKPDDKGWWVVDNEYLIAYKKGKLTESEGYSIKAQYPVYPWLPLLSPPQILVLHKP